MKTYTQHELETLERWLQQKISSIPTNPANSPEEYGDVNLSKAVLTFIKYLVEQERDKKTRSILDNMHNYGYNIGPSVVTYTSSTVPYNANIVPNSSAGVTVNNIDAESNHPDTNKKSDME